MSKVKERQRFIRYWMDQTGETEIDMHAVAKMALKMGWDVPPPISTEGRLAKLFKDAARQDIRHDRKTERPYGDTMPFRNLMQAASWYFLTSTLTIRKPSRKTSARPV